MRNKKLEEIESLGKAIQEYHYRILSNVGIFQTVEDDLANEHIKEAGRLRRQVRHLDKGWKVRKTRKNADTAQKEVVIPYYLSLLDSLVAQVEIAREPGFRKSKEMYELNLAADSLTLSDVEDAVEVYHQAVLSFLELQKAVSGLEFHFEGSQYVPEYERTCGGVTNTLDKMASKLFGRKIITPADFDVKEKMPHQFLGRINVGYERFMPNLVRTVAHEGPFGHNIHQILSEETNFNHLCMHTQEGLAILGEELALEMNYNPSQEANPALVGLFMYMRIMNSALGAAYEKAAFFDCLSEAAIVRMLESRILHKERITQNIKGLEEKRDVFCHQVFTNYPSSHYYAGLKLVKPIYQQAREALKKLAQGDDDLAEQTKGLLLTMYSGHRPVAIIAKHVDLYIQQQKAKK